MKYCKCGCGAIVKKNYVKGHNSRGRKPTQLTREKMSFSQKERTKDAKTRIPFEVKKCLCGCGQEFRAKLYWKDGEYKYKEFISGHNSRLEDHKEKARVTIKIAAEKAHKVNRGENHYFYTGQYISMVRGRYHILCRDKTKVQFARAVMEAKIGRKLKKGEVVHHIDGDKTNDHPENLMLFSSTSEHIQWHWDNDMGPNKKLKRQLCLCGCGKLTSPGKRFLSGHNSRINNPMKKG